ncbi:MAG TPA: hypothetical protein VJT74_03200 [Pyrinomonadaceae bacterium]|nr:hypothetical protein [Pyrinomonadaceae bacterium]
MSEETTQQLPNDLLKLILARLDTLEEKVDKRLQETRPIWEGVLVELKEVKTRLTNIERDYKDFRRLFRYTFSNLSRVQEDIEERLDKLEGRDVPT